MNVLADWYRRHLTDPQVVLLIVILLMAIAVIAIFGDMLAPVIAAVVIAFLLDGPAEWLRRRGYNNLVAVISVFMLFMVLTFVGFFTILPPIAEQFSQFFRQLPDMFNSFQAFVMTLPQSYPEIVNEAQVSELMSALRTEMLNAGQRAVEFSVGSIGGLITLIVYLILVPVMVFFFLKDKEPVLAWFGGFLPKEKPVLDQVWAEAVERTGDYARGKVYEILIVGFVSWGAYSLIDLQFAAFLALLTGISVIVPYLGAALVTIPVALVALFQWGLDSQTLVAVATYLVLQALDGNLLAPVLYSEVVKLHPNSIILAILIFGGIWGVWGVFFAIPLATLAHAVIKAWTLRARTRLAD